MRCHLINDALKSDSVSFEQFWNDCHAVNDQHFLTGSSGRSVWSSLNITDRVKAGAKVLNIGVGLGFCTNELVKAGCVVDVLDISPVALERVSKIVRKAWLPSQFESMPIDYYDLIISHLVTQHMPDGDLTKQVTYTVKALNKIGVFAMQFACRFPIISDGKTSISMKDTKAGGSVRTLEKIDSLVRSCGGQIVWNKMISVYQRKGSCWFGVHIARTSY